MKLANSLYLHCTRMSQAKPTITFIGPISPRRIKFLFGLSVANVFIGVMYGPKAKDVINGS